MPDTATPSPNAPADGAPLMVTVSGCRGIVGRSLTPETIARYAWAFGAGLDRDGRRPRVVLGRDGRRGGEAIARVVAGSLASAGIDVVDLGVAMTPTVGLAVRETGADGGLVVTASHNPGEWNGLKPITPEGRAPLPDGAAALIDRFRSGGPEWAPADEVGGVSEDPTAPDLHAERVLAALAGVSPAEPIRSRGFRVALDSVNASGAVIGRDLLERLGCRVEHVNAEPTGIFPHTPEPTRENLAGLSDQVTAAGADVGFAQDPDGDRLAIIDETGRYIGEEYTLVLAALALLGSMGPDRAQGAALAANLSTSRMIDDVASAFGARVVRTPVGEANVVAGMESSGAVLGGEGNGGVIWPEVVSIRDSAGSMALVLALMAREGRPLSAIVDDIAPYAIDKRKLPIEPGMAERVVAGLRDAFPGADADSQDGIRLDFAAPSGSGRAWLHARPSNTEPIFRLIAEAPTPEDAASIVETAIGAASG